MLFIWQKNQQDVSINPNNIVTVSSLGHDKLPEKIWYHGSPDTNTASCALSAQSSLIWDVVVETGLCKEKNESHFSHFISLQLGINQD